MASANLLQQISTLRKSLLNENIINEYFASLEEYTDNGNPEFLEELVNLFFRDSTIVIASMEQNLEMSSVDFSNLDVILYCLKTSSLSIGATKVTLQIEQLKQHVGKPDLDGFKATLANLKIEHAHLKEKLEHYFQLKKEARIAERAARKK